MSPKIGQKWKHKYRGFTAIVIKLYLKPAAVMYKPVERNVVYSDLLANFLEYFEPL